MKAIEILNDEINKLSVENYQAEQTINAHLTDAINNLELLEVITKNPNVVETTVKASQDWNLGTNELTYGFQIGFEIFKEDGRKETLSVKIIKVTPKTVTYTIQSDMDWVKREEFKMKKEDMITNLLYIQNKDSLIIN